MRTRYTRPLSRSERHASDQGLGREAAFLFIDDEEHKQFTELSETLRLRDTEHAQLRASGEDLVRVRFQNSLEILLSTSTTVSSARCGEVLNTIALSSQLPHEPVREEPR